MVEILKHMFGLCGEGHLHFFTLTPFVVGMVGYFYYIKQKISTICKKIWYRYMTI